MQLWDVFGASWIDEHKLVEISTILLAAIAWAAYKSWPRLIFQRYRMPNVEIRLVEGDLFDQSENLAIGFSDTYDTATPNIIERQSLLWAVTTSLLFRGCRPT